MTNITATIKLDVSDMGALLRTMRNFNGACNWLSQVAFEEKIFHWLKLQRWAYHELRQQFNLTSTQSVVAIRKVAYAYKKDRSALREFRLTGAMPLYRHRYKRDNIVNFYGMCFSYSTRPGAKLDARHQANLIYRDKQFFIQQVINVPVEEEYKPVASLGVDLGIVNIASDSDGVRYSGGHLNGLRKRHAKLRTRLQLTGTRSAKRLLLKRKHKEHRFGSWVNHNISKKLVTKAKDTFRAIALEDLKGIRERLTVRKAQRRSHSSWSFNQLRQFIEYKAEIAGVPFLLVNPRNTSRSCPNCGLIDKRNRSSQSEFKCISCNFAGHADTVAAENIRRASSDKPYATLLGAVASPVEVLT